MPGAVPEPYREVERFRRHVDAIIVGRNAQVDVRTGARDPIKSRKQPAGSERADNTDVQYLAKPSIGILIEHRAQPIEHLGQHGRQRLSVVGECQTTRQPMEQARAEPPFELRNLMDDRPLADAQFDRRAREVEMARRRVESAQGIKRNLGTIHRSSMNSTHGSVEK